LVLSLTGTIKTKFIIIAVQKLLFLVSAVINRMSIVFCTSVGGNPGNTEGSDILFTRMERMAIYIAEILTEKGQAVAEIASVFLKDWKTADKEKFLADVPVKFNHNEISEKLDKFFESKEWVDQSLRCLGCGACAYVCPTCACF